MRSDRLTDRTADLNENGTPRPIKLRVLASAIASVVDTDVLFCESPSRDARLGSDPSVDDSPISH